MWTTGKGMCPQNAFFASQRSTFESLPMDQSIAGFSKPWKASRMR